MDNNIDARKFIEENKGFRNEIKKLKFKRFHAKFLDFTLRTSKLVYIIPIIIILSLFAYNRLVGAFVAIAYLFIASTSLKKFEKYSKTAKFIDDFSEMNCKDRIQEIESKIEYNSSCSVAAREGRGLPESEYAEII